MAPTEPKTRRIVLLGKTGSGKSSLANTLFRDENVFKANNSAKKKFSVNESANSGTKFCESKIKNINGRNIQLIDTPGLFDTDPRSTELNPELLKCITECAPGPHALLLVLKVEKYTMLEIAVVALMLKCFSKEALKYTTVVFTRGDDLPEGENIKDWVSQNKDLSDLVQKCGGRCHVFDNKYWNNSQDQYRNNQYQVQELLKTIDQTVRENGGGYYTNELLQRIPCLAKQIKDAFSGNISGIDIDKKANKAVYIKLMSVMGGVTIGILLGAFLGGLGIGGLAFYFGASKLGITVAGTLGAVAGGAVVGAVGGAIWWAAEGLTGGAVKASKSSPTEAPQEAISFSRDIDDLFLQLQKISKGVLAVTGVASKSKSD